MALASACLLLLVLALTLAPMKTTEAVVPGTCVWCGYFALADAILNVLLFVPLGFLFALRRRAIPLRVWGGLTMLAAGIEALQVFLPGRYPTVSDVVANSLGAALGLLLASGWKKGLPVHLRDAGALPLTAGLVAGIASIGATLLLLPSLPRSDWFGQWTADLGHYEHYDGEVLDAAIGGLETPSRRLRDAPAVRTALLAGDPVRVRFVAGTAPEALAPIFSIYDGMEREIFVLGGRHEDLVVRVRRLASELRLRSPEALFRRSAPTVGDTALIRVSLRGGGACTDLPGGPCRSLAPPGRGWSLLLGAAPSLGLEALADGAWLALFFLPLGYGFRRNVMAYAGLGIAIAGLLAAALLSGGLQPVDWLVTGSGAAIGMVAGAWAGRWIPAKFRYRTDLSPRR